MGVMRSATAIAVALCATVLAALATSPAGAANPTTWVLSASSNTSGTLTNVLFADSCVAGGTCLAVGNSTTAAGRAQTLIESWNGTSWATVPSPDTSANLDNALYAVSCTSASACTAVGTSTSALGHTQTLAEVWKGSTWSLTPTPDTSTGFDNTLSGVSCTSGSSCTAVGYAATATGSVTLVETWNGSAWSMASSPNQTGTLDDSLSAVSCGAATSCVGVGNYLSGSNVLQTLTESWNGSTWSVSASPDTTTSLANTLNGVSCMSSVACVAVGAAYAPGGTAYRTLAESWNGTTWSIVPTVNVSVPDDELLAVTCASPSACTAAGYSTTSAGIQQGLIESWNGANWAVVTTPEPGTYGNSLQGIACLEASACAAVGSQDVSPGVLQTVAETTFVAPTLTSPPAAVFTFGAPGSVAVSATGSPAPTFAASGAPTGVVIDPVTGTLSGTPNQLGTFPVTITASNGVAPAAAKVLQLTVVGTQITTTTLPPATRGVPYSAQLMATGGAATLAWKKSAKFPRGLKLSPDGVISGTPSLKLAAGAYGLKVSVTEITAVGKLKVVATVTLPIQ
jgi:hypothetical protein